MSTYASGSGQGNINLTPRFWVQSVMRFPNNPNFAPPPPYLSTFFSLGYGAGLPGTDNTAFGAFGFGRPVGLGRVIVSNGGVTTPSTINLTIRMQALNFATATFTTKQIIGPLPVNNLPSAPTFFDFDPSVATVGEGEGLVVGVSGINFVTAGVFSPLFGQEIVLR